MTTKSEIRTALAQKGIKSELLVDKFAQSLAACEARGGMKVIVADIEARIEAARQRCAAGLGPKW